MSNWKNRRHHSGKKARNDIMPGHPPKLWYELRAQAGKLVRKKKLTVKETV
jgi:hypothetical protein